MIEDENMRKIQMRNNQPLAMWISYSNAALVKRKLGIQRLQNRHAR